MKNQLIRKLNWHWLSIAILVFSLALPQLGKGDPTRPVPFPWGSQIDMDWKYINGSYFGDFEGQPCYFFFTTTPSKSGNGVYVKLFIFDPETDETIYRGQVFALRGQPSVSIKLNGGKKVTISKVMADPGSQVNTPWWFPADRKPHLVTIIQSGASSRSRAIETVTVLTRVL